MAIQGKRERGPQSLHKTYTPAGETLERFHASDARVRFLMGAVGSGKTTACIWELIRRACEQKANQYGLRRTRWLVVRSSFPELENATLPSWFDEIPEQFGQFSWSKPYHHYIRFEDVQCEVLFMGLDDPDGPEKIKGMQFTGAWLNEVITIPPSVINMIGSRINRFPPMWEGGPTWSGIFGDTNAPEEGHWYHKMAEEEAPEGWEFYSQPPAVKWNGQKWVPNPYAENLRNLPEDYYEAQIAGKTDDEIRVLLANEYGFIVRGKAVFPEFNDRLHTQAYEPERGMPLALGVDCTGLRPAAVIGQRVPSGQIRVFSEVVTDNMGAVRFAPHVRDHLNRHYPGWSYEHMTGDPRGDQRASTDERRTLEILNAAGLPIVQAHTNDFTTRREAVAKLLSTVIAGVGEPALVFHPRCVVTRKGLAGGYLYRRMKTRDDQYEEKASKNRFSDPIDALQYLCLGYGAGRAVVMQEKRNRRPINVSVETDYDPFAYR